MSTETIGNPPSAADYQRTAQNLQHIESLVNGEAGEVAKPGGGTRPSLAQRDAQVEAAIADFQGRFDAASADLLLARDEALAAAAAALSAGRMYLTRADGLAAVSATTLPDSVFWVLPNVTDSLTAPTAYRRTGAGGSDYVFVYALPTSADIESALATLADLTAALSGIQNGYGIPGAVAAAVRVVGNNGRIIAQILNSGAYDGPLSQLRDTTGLSLAEVPSISDEAVRVVGSNGRIIQRISPPTSIDALSAEVAAARGSRPALATRLNTSLSAYGLPIRHQWGEWLLRETRQRLRKRLLGESALLSVAVIGDSWTAKAYRYAQPLARSLRALAGNAGNGWVGFARGSGTGDPEGNVFSDEVTVTLTGSWVTSYWTGDMPSISKITSSTIGDRVAVTAPGGVLSAVLFHDGAGGSIRYRYNAGAWTVVALTGSGTTALALDAPPAGALALDIEVESGTVVLGGIDLRAGSNGVRVHKLGCSGSRAEYWSRMNSASWLQGLTELAPNLITICLATNDQKDYSPSAYGGYLQTVITRLRSALPLADILLIAPAENGDDVEGHKAPMPDYATELARLAYVNNCAYLDLQYLFGAATDFASYSSASARAWFEPDNIHPSTEGGYAIADGFVRLLTTH